MLFTKLLSTTGKETGVGQFPFSIIKQPVAGAIACNTVKISDGVYAQAPRLQQSDSPYYYYNGTLFVYSSADGIRPEATHFQYDQSFSRQVSNWAKLGTKEFTIILQPNNAENIPNVGNESAIDYTYAEGFPVDKTSGNFTTSRNYAGQIYNTSSPTVSVPSNFGTSWWAYFMLMDSTHRNIHTHGNRNDWANTVFKVILGRSNTYATSKGWIQRVDNGSVTWTKQLSDATKADPSKGINLYCCGTNGEDTLVVYGAADGGMALIQANGTVSWARDQLDANDADSSQHFIDPTGTYAYSVDRRGYLYRITLSDGSVHYTPDTYADGVPSNATYFALNQCGYCGGFDSDGYLWVVSNQYDSLTKMDVSGANPIALGSYRAGSNGNGVLWNGPLVDGDRIVAQAVRQSGSYGYGSWFVCLATDFSTTTIDGYAGRVYTKKYGIGSNGGGEDYIRIMGVYTTSRTGSWTSYTTSSTSVSITDDTSGYDYDTNAAIVDTVMNSAIPTSVHVRSQSTVS